MTGLLVWEGPLNFRAADGGWVDVPSPRYEGPPSGGNPATRSVTIEGRRLVCRRVTEPGTSAGRRALSRLDDEIRVLKRLARFFGDDYPPELARVVGYDMDDVSPYAIFDVGGDGEPVQESAGEASIDEQEAFLIGLLRGLDEIHQAGLVHRRLGPGNVLWNGEHVKITDFSGAVPVGTPREPYGAGGWNRTEQIAGVGTAEPADDVWTAATLAIYLAAGRLPQRGSGPGSDGGMGPLAGKVRNALQGVFAADPAARPTVTTMLARLGQAAVARRVDQGRSEKFEEGRRRYDQIRMQKDPAAPRDQAPAPPPPPSPPPPPPPPPLPPPLPTPAPTEPAPPRERESVAVTPPNRLVPLLVVLGVAVVVVFVALGVGLG